MISGANTTSPRTEMALMIDVQKRDPFPKIDLPLCDL